MLTDNNNNNSSSTAQTTTAQTSSAVAAQDDSSRLATTKTTRNDDDDNDADVDDKADESRPAKKVGVPTVIVNSPKLHCFVEQNSAANFRYLYKTVNTNSKN